MAAINEAWHVLSDPGRRAMYDASLRDHRVGVPRSVSEPVYPDDLDDPAGFEPVPSGHPVRWGIPLGWAFVIVVLGVIFVFTAYATSRKDDPRPDKALVAGNCVAIDGEQFAVEVPCGGPHAGVVQTVPPPGAPCPTGTSGYRDRQTRTTVCVMED
jgi:molecular chaperone DnaJ